jgi:23S rRNA (pseudouridine1915-N3)-methyltransferase
MQQVRIATIGKKLESSLDEYIKRLQPYLTVQWYLLRDDAALEKWASQQRRCILLDPAGKLMDSTQFSHALTHELTASGAQLSLIIGGPNGFRPEFRNSHTLWSLSPLTFSHPLTRLVLMEQIYRAICIANNLPFPR